MTQQQERIENIRQAIIKAQAEVDSLQQEKAAAFDADDPEGLANIDKHLERANSTLAALEKAMEAAAYTPPAMTDKEELLQGLKKYAQEKDTKTAKVKNAIKAARREQARIEAALQQAAIDCDTEKTITLSGDKAENEKKLKYLSEMLERTEALPTYKPGDFEREWNAITEKMLPVWNQQVSQLEAAAAIYEDAATALIQMYSTLRDVQNDMRRTATKNGINVYFPPVFTADMDTNRLTVNRAKVNQIAAMKSVVTQSI